MNVSSPNAAEARLHLREQVVEAASKAFHSKGVKNVTMDDVSHLLSISKRTLYQLFSDKEELLLACAQKRAADSRLAMEKVVHQDGNMLDKLLTVFLLKIRELTGVTNVFFDELYKYPRVVAFFDDLRTANVRDAVTFFRLGVEEGYFRPDVNFDIVCNRILDGIGISISNPIYEGYSHTQIFSNTIIAYVRGCATIKGIEIIDAFIDNHKDEIHW